MKIIVNQKDLSKHINIAQKGISNKSTMQILDGIKLSAKDNKLKLIGTDLEISIETSLNCQIIEEGAIVVNSRIFGDIIKKLPNEPITITVKDNNINVLCANSEFNIAGNSGDDYPELPIILEKDTFKIPKDLFKEVITQTTFARAKDETRPSLTGILSEITEKEVSFVSLDGYRLALKHLDLNTDLDENIIIPGRTLEELNKILDGTEDDLKISLSPGHIMFNMGETIMYSRLLEGQFFNYRDIIRKDHKTEIVVDKNAFQNGLERASLLAKEEKANLVKLTISDDKVIIRSNSEIGNVHEEIDGEQEGEDLNIAFNSRYLLEGIRIIDSEKITLNFMGSLNPCIIQGSDKNYTYLVLPVRLAQGDF